MRPPIDGVVVVTGASSGIGREIARLLAPRAKALVLVARRKDRLDELALELCKANKDLRVHVEVRDLADPSVVGPMVQSIRDAVGEVDVLVNNAGFGDMGVFDRSDATKLESMIAVNVTTLALLTRAVVSGMVERKRGGILMVSSGFGVTFLPGFAGYIGTKHFVTGFAEGLRLDLAGTGVVVTQVCPGPVATEFESNVGNFTGEKVPGFIEISAERCARAAVRGFVQGRAMVVPGVVVQIGLWLAAMTPKLVLRALYGLIGRLLRKRQDRALAAPPPPEGSATRG